MDRGKYSDIEYRKLIDSPSPVKIKTEENINRSSLSQRMRNVCKSLFSSDNKKYDCRDSTEVNVRNVSTQTEENLIQF